MAEHTPGHWEAWPAEGDGLSRVNARTDPEFNEYVHICDALPANARLIAAAPELLAALEETKMYLMAKARKHPAERNIVALIRVTIANATVG